MALQEICGLSNENFNKNSLFSDRNCYHSAMKSAINLEDPLNLSVPPFQNVRLHCHYEAEFCII